MPFAQFTGTGNGSTKQFTIPFPYVKKDHIVVALGLVANTNFTFVNDTTIEFDTLSSATSTQEATGAPKTGVVIEITRDTPLTNALVDFVDGSTLTAADLDTAVLQLLYGIQEAKDEAALGIQNTPQGQDAQSKPIINVSDPTNAQDAVTKAFLERVGSITSTQIADGTIVNADVNASAAIAGTKISPDFGSQNIATSGTVDGRDVSADGTKLDGIESGATADQTNAEIKTAYEANSNTNNFTDALLAKLNAIEANATTDQTIAEIKSLIAGSPLDASHLAADSVTSSELAANSVDSSELVDGSIDHSHLSNDCVDGDNIADNAIGSEHLQANSVGTSEIADAELTTLAGMQSGTASKLADSTALTSDIADLNQIDGMAKQTTITDDDTKFPTSGAVVDYVAAQIAPIGGLEVIANDQSFPNTQPSSGVVISIADAGGLVVDANGTSATARTANGTTVTINNFASNFNSSTVDAGVAIMVSSTGSGQVYNYHKATLKEADLLNLSNDINDFGNRYRVTNGEPSSNNDEGDLIYDKNADKMKVFDSTTNAFKEVTSVGDFKFLFLCPAGGSGSPTINGSIATYDLREGSTSGSAASVTNAAQLLVSVNGVLQKPNTGTSAPSEGFAIVDSNTIIFGSNLPTGAEVFVTQIGSAISLQVPADNTVATAKIQNQGVTTAKIADANVTEVKLASNSVSNSKLTNSSVDENKLAVNSVTTAKIADDAVTTAKIAANQVTSNELAGDAVSTGNIADNAVSSNKIQSSAVTTAKIAGLAITQAEIANGAVGQNQLASGAVITGKIADEAVTLAKLSHGDSNNDGKFLRANNGADPTFEDVVSVGQAHNTVINGEMLLAQRSTSDSFGSGGYKTMDRWETVCTSAGTWNQSQSNNRPSGFGKSLLMSCLATASLSSSTILTVRQSFEGQDIQHFRKGGGDAKAITVSFYVKTNKSGTYLVELYDTDNTKIATQSYTVSSGDTGWNRYSVTFPASTNTGQFNCDNGKSLMLSFFLAAGSSYTSGTASGSFAQGSNANRGVGQTVNLADSTSNQWYLTGVQMEAGSTMNEYAHESFPDTVSKCERYYHQTQGNMFWQTNVNGSDHFKPIQFPTTMRSSPSVSFYNVTGDGGGGSASGANPNGYQARLNGNGRHLSWAHKASAEL